MGQKVSESNGKREFAETQGRDWYMTSILQEHTKITLYLTDSNIRIWKKNKAKNDSKKRTKAARKAGADGSDKVPQTGKGAVSEGKGT